MVAPFSHFSDMLRLPFCSRFGDRAFDSFASSRVLLRWRLSWALSPILRSGRRSRCRPEHWNGGQEIRRGGYIVSGFSPFTLSLLELVFVVALCLAILAVRCGHPDHAHVMVRV